MEELRAKAVESMRTFFEAEERYVSHALRVTEYAEDILEGEGLKDPFIREVVTLSGLFHDVGIPAALEKHGTSAGPYQEAEGEPLARRLLTGLSVRAEVLERVCYIVRHHHTQSRVDGLDFQILWEADALVNIPNWWGKRQSLHTLPELMGLNFKTTTGKRLFADWSRQQAAQ